MAIALYYSIATGRLRQIVCDHDKTLDQILVPHAPRAGEAVIFFPGLECPSVEVGQAAVNVETGTSPVNDRFVQVSNNHITGIITADEAIDTIPAGWFKNQDARMGDRQLSDGSFVRSTVEIDKYIAGKLSQIDGLPSRTEPTLTEIEIDTMTDASNQEIEAMRDEKAST
jgi:hypothetical protein